MSKYRLYKCLNKRWEKTSYVGEKELMLNILRSLSHSNIYRFDIKEEH